MGQPHSSREGFFSQEAMANFSCKNQKSAIEKVFILVSYVIYLLSEKSIYILSGLFEGGLLSPTLIYYGRLKSSPCPRYSPLDRFFRQHLLDVNEKIAELIERVVTAEGFELVHCELVSAAKQKVLRVLVDHPRGITHEHCSYLSQQIGVHLDQADLIRYGYTLEVSSPGVERGLYQIADYCRFTGRSIRLRTSTALEGRRNFRGILTGVREPVRDHASVPELAQEALVVLAVKGIRQEVEIPFSWIEKANLEVGLDELFRAAQEKTKNTQP